MKALTGWLLTLACQKCSYCFELDVFMFNKNKAMDDIVMVMVTCS